MNKLLSILLLLSCTPAGTGLNDGKTFGACKLTKTGCDDPNNECVWDNKQNLWICLDPIFARLVKARYE